MEHLVRLRHCAAVCKEMNCSRRSFRPLRIQCNIFGFIVCACAVPVFVAIAFSVCKSVVPTEENITLTLRHRHFVKFTIVINRCRCFCRDAVIAVKSHRIGICRPLCVQSSLGGNGIVCKIPLSTVVFFIPTVKSIACTGRLYLL